MLYTSRKIFFLNPETTLEKDSLAILARDEYEVYSISDVNLLLKALTFFDQSIVCVNTFHKNKYSDVEKLYSLIKNSPDLKDADVCTYYLKDGLLTLDIENTSLNPPSNCFRLDQEYGQNLILSFFESIGARGNRRYIRVHCSEMEVSHISLENDEDIYTGKINDISSIGLSCCIKKMEPIKKGVIINDVAIRLNNLRFKCDCISMGYRGSGRNVIQILIFKNLDPAFKIKLSGYIYESLQESFAKVMSTLDNL